MIVTQEELLLLFGREGGFFFLARDPPGALFEGVTVLANVNPEQMSTDKDEDEPNRNLYKSDDSQAQI